MPLHVEAIDAFEITECGCVRSALKVYLEQIWVNRWQQSLSPEAPTPCSTQAPLMAIAEQGGHIERKTGRKAAPSVEFGKY